MQHRLIASLSQQDAVVQAQTDTLQQASNAASLALDNAQADEATLQQQISSLVVGEYEASTSISPAALLASRSLHAALSSVSLIEDQNRYLAELHASLAAQREDEAAAYQRQQISGQELSANALEGQALENRIELIQAQLQAAHDRAVAAKQAKADAAAAAAAAAQRQQQLRLQLAAQQAASMPGMLAADGSGDPLDLAGGGSPFGSAGASQLISFGSAAPNVPPTPAASMAIDTALSYIGTPYVWGGNSPSPGFDCSGLVQYSYRMAGIALSRTTYTQSAAGVHVPDPSQVQPGDVLFFENLGHEALYIGNGLVVQAPHTGDVVKITPAAQLASEIGYVGAIRPSLQPTPVADVPLE
jgi:cell wall-associated NlpC family hydrolase